jgi:restriction endonuclease Mrr
MRELLEKIAEIAAIPETVQNVMHAQRQTKLSYNLAWAKTYLGKFGALDNLSHGVWAITKKGNALTESDMKQIPVEFGNSTGSKRRRNPKKLMSNHWSPKVRTGRTISSASLHRSILMPSSDWPSEFSANLDSLRNDRSKWRWRY